MTPKLSRAAPSILDKVRSFEERKGSVEEEGAGVEGGSGLRRRVFKQRASSLEERPTYTQRVHSFQNKFTEELQRIKRLVAHQPHLKKAVSSGQLSQRHSPALGRLEPLSPGVLQRLDHRERTLEAAGVGGREERKEEADQRQSQDSSTPQSAVTMETAPEPREVQRGKASSPVQSDEEYRSTADEVMEAQRPEPKGKKVHFREPPTLQLQHVLRFDDLKMWYYQKTADNNMFDYLIAPAPSAELAITMTMTDAVVRAGESAMFECHMTGPQDVEIDWLANGKLIQPALLRCKMLFDGKKCRLLLNSLHEDDSGTYTCKLSTAKEEITSSANLKVTPSRAPLFTRKLDVLEVPEGRPARFDCKVSGSPPPVVTWSQYETALQEGDNIHMIQDGGRHSLLIGRVRSDTEGFYTAVARNPHGEDTCNAELYMQESRLAVSSHMARLEKMPSIPEEPEAVPEAEQERRNMPDFVKPLVDIEVGEGKEAVLRCKVAGLPYPSISWYHQGRLISNSQEHRMTQHRDVHSLVIGSVCRAHAGVYKSVISNKVGKAACYAHLYVTDIVPEPPEGAPVVESITGQTITLSWKKPKRLDSTESSPVGWVVQQQALGSVQWIVVASNLREPCYTVTSLAKGCRYAFRVLASTAKVLSKPSPSTDLIQLLDRGPYLRRAPIIMDKPGIVYAVENQPASVIVTLNHVHAVVTWKRRGVVLTHRPGVSEMSMPDDDQHTLKIQRVRTTDVGQLVVMATNQFGSDLCTLQLALAVRPKFESIMEDLQVHVGEMLRFAVVVEGKPDPDILWYKDDVLLSESSHVTFVYDEAESSLVVLNARAEHAGVYTCTAKNLGGTVSCKAELTVHTESRAAVVEPEEKEERRRLTDYYRLHREIGRSVSMTTTASTGRGDRQVCFQDYYRLHREIGRGAFSYVKRVVQKEGQEEELAAKFIWARGTRRKAGALREVKLLAGLHHHNILFYHDALEKKNTVILITELCREELLDRWIKKTSIMETEVRSSMRQVLEAVSYLHQRDIVHLDIKPENVLLAGGGGDQVRLCDFGSAVILDHSQEHYHIYGTPEYVAPEIVNQTPVTKATDIWPVGVMTYLCLTGVSPFVGENDRTTALNIRNYNVSFEEDVFAGLMFAKGFVIKLLVNDTLRPSAQTCLLHPWFKSTTNKSISTTMLKQVLSRRRAVFVCLQRSLISYKSKMVMRTIPELLNDSTNHIVSLAVPRHLTEDSPPPSSSSSSDEDVEELPIVPTPLSSGTRVSLTEIRGEEEEPAMPSNGIAQGAGIKTEGVEPGQREAGRMNVKEEEVKKEESTRSRRSTMRRGSSADSALLLSVTAHPDPETNEKNLKKSVSMELPNGSSSPVFRPSQEDYALKLELMRQRLLRPGGARRGERGGAGGGGEEDGITGPGPQEDGITGPGPQEDGVTGPGPQEDGVTGPKPPEGVDIEEETDSTSYSQRAEHPAVFARVTPSDRPITPQVSSSVLPDRPIAARQPTLRVDIQDMDSEEVFEARFKKRESSLTRGLKRLTRSRSQESRRSPTQAQRGEEEVYRPGPARAPLEMVSRGLQEKSRSVNDLQEREVGLGLIGRFSMRARRSGSVDKREERVKSLDGGSDSSVLTLRQRFERKDKVEVKGQDPQGRSLKKESSSPVLVLKKRFDNITGKIRSQSEDRSGGAEVKPEVTPGVKPEVKPEVKHEVKPEVKPEVMTEVTPKVKPEVTPEVKTEVTPEVKTEVTPKVKPEVKPEVTPKVKPEVTPKVKPEVKPEVTPKVKPEVTPKVKPEVTPKVKPEVRLTPPFSRHSHSHSEGGQRSRWERWGLGRSPKDQTPSDISQEEEPPSHFPPVFHIKLKDHVLLEGDPVTLSCLPAGSPPPLITWIKDKRPLAVEDRMSQISHPDGRQLLMILRTSRRDAGLYECVATNPLGASSSSSSLSLACVPKRPGTPEVPQTYNNTALVLWKPADTKAPCSYTLERQREGESGWLIVATGVADCYCNVTELPAGGSYRFRVACVNKAGQGPYSHLSARVTLETKAVGSSPAVAVVKTVPAPPTGLPTSSPVNVAPPLSKPQSPVNVAPPVSKPQSLVNVAPPLSKPQSPVNVAPPLSKPQSPVNVAPPLSKPQSLVNVAPPLSKPQSPVNVAPPLSKPQSPVNVVPPMTQTLPLVTPPSSPTKPVAASLPLYTPTSCPPLPLYTPTSSPALPLCRTSQNLVTGGDVSPSRSTSSGRGTPGGLLRQGLPQKPYTFMEEKARGRFGVVRECRENSTGNVFMAKIVPYDQESKAWVLREYELLKALRCEKIMALHEAYVTPRYLVLVAEHCTGKELLPHLVDRFCYSEDDVVGYLVQTLQGVEYLHNKRILHLDLRPDNIMVTQLNTVKILDFGSAQTFNPLCLRAYPSTPVLLHYSAPEVMNAEVLGPPADIWSLGVITFIMLSGRLPFPDRAEFRTQQNRFDPTRLYPNVSHSATSFLKKMLSSTAWSRPSTKDCFTHAWLQDSYLTKLRRQTLTFTTTALTHFLGEESARRAQDSTKHKVLLRSYTSSAL
ncbi:striated muscle preferentially expressed protein kinase-like [Aplochiton taeniatus]